ncbi:hypothetical protein ACQ4PT_019186 [Festuca glaucescens]
MDSMEPPSMDSIHGTPREQVVHSPESGRSTTAVTGQKSESRMVVQTCHAIRAMRSGEKPDIRMASNAGVALAGSTLMNQQDGNNINILRTSVEEPADDCSAETMEVTHLNNGVGESIGHIRVRTPDRAGLVSTVGSISKSWQSSNVAHNVMESQSEERRSADYSDAAVSGSTTPVRPHGVDQGSSVDTNNNGKLKGDADAAVGDAGITTDINEPLLMVGPTAGFNAAADTDGSDNEQSSEVHTSQLTITQSQSVDGTETPTQVWQVEEQLAEERVKIDQKKAAKKRKIAIDGVKKRLVLATTTEDSAEDDHDQHDDMDDQPAPLAVQFPRCDTQAAKQAKPRRHKKRRASTSTNLGPQQKRRRSSRLSKKGKEAVDTGHRRSDGNGSGDDHDPDYNVISEEYDEHEHDDDVSPGATDDDREGKKECKSETELAHYRKGFHKGAANRKSGHNNSDKTSKEHSYAIVVAGNAPDQLAGPSDTRAIKVGSHISDCEKLKQAMAIIQQVAQQPHDLYTSLDDDEQTKLNTKYIDYVKKMSSLVWSSANGLKNYMEIEHARLASRVEQSRSAHNSTSVEMTQDKLIVDDAELPYGANDIDLQKCAGQSGLKIMFPVLDNPENRRGILGHWFTLAIDIVDRKFRVYDSLREPGNKDLEKICTPMVKLLKHMWNEGFRSTQSNVRTLDDYEVVYEHMPLQENGCDCGFFMLYMLENCTGQHIPNFNKDDIEQYKELFLMKMLTAEIFDISVEAMDDSILCTGESEFNRMFSNKSFQDCRDQILRGIAVREVEHSQREMVALEETSQIEIDKKRNANRPAKIKASMHNDERRRNDQDEINGYKPLEFKAAREASKIRKLIINNRSKEEYAETIFVDTTTYNGSQDAPVTYSANQLADIFKKNGWIDTEFVDAVISRWRHYDEFKYLFQDGKRVILPVHASALLQITSQDDEFKPYEVAETMKYLIADDDLMKADMILLPVLGDQHFTVYVLNRIYADARVDILDSRRHKNVNDRNEYHSRIGAIMLRRFDQVMDHVYPGNTMPRWSDLFEHANYVKAIKQEEDASGLYMLYFLQRYNGEALVESIKKATASRLRDEHLYLMIFHRSNVAFKNIPQKIKDLSASKHNEQHETILID